MRNKKIGKKGIGVGQSFIFIIAAITFGLIMLFGYKAIPEFVQKGEAVEYITFKSGLEKSINKISTDFGSVNREVFRLPGKYEKICFVNMDYQSTPEQQQQLCDQSFYACDTYNDVKNELGGWELVSENIFLEPRFEDTIPIKTNRIKVSSPDGSIQKLFECLEVVNGQIEITMEGKGDSTEISLPLAEN